MDKQGMRVFLQLSCKDEEEVRWLEIGRYDLRIQETLQKRHGIYAAPKYVTPFWVSA